MRMAFGGFVPPRGDGLRPEGARYIGGGLSLWRLGQEPYHSAASRRGRRVTLLGCCGATGAELNTLATAPLPADITWRWPGTYAVVEEWDDQVVLHTDPVGALPLYATRFESGWAWSTSARALASLTTTSPDVRRMVCGVFAPSVPAAAETRSFFTGVRQLTPGSRIVLSADGRQPRLTTIWDPAPRPGAPHRRLRRALTASVSVRVTLDADLTCDLSGGLDSTTMAVLASAARNGHRPLNAVTVHPRGNESGADLRYARQAAAAYPERITHHLYPLGTEHLPYTRIWAVPATDEPAPSTLTRARLESQLNWMRTQLGSRTHLTGDGGDSVLFQPPARLADLVRNRRFTRTVAEALGWARLRHCGLAPVLRDARNLARTSRRDALAALVRTLESPAPANRPDRDNLRWFAPLPIPAWATPTAVRLLSEAVADAAEAADPLPGLDISSRTLVDEIREVARTAAADVELAAACGISLHNPFLDAHVVDAVLRTPLDRRPPVHAYKPVLARAMKDLLPPQVAARTTKGSFNADHYAGMRANFADLLELADGRLAAIGLVDPAGLRRHLSQAAAGVPMPLATIEQVLSTEAWLYALDRESGPSWTRTARDVSSEEGGDNRG
ncbi:albusnodin/ikarugamycin family macrolactam cyclase [Streptomyces niveus]|uniref:albusnodin/ikarugamycin family macrolactam cyclase n=1 Tax=Streptomyces niveus TaxID=193462 RepID=UPI0036744211